MPHTIHIDDEPQGVLAEEGETILDALLRNGTAFAYSCQAGNCGSCKCRYVSGDIVELACSEQALSPAERAGGIVLACRTRVRSDVRIGRLTAESVVMHPARTMQCRLIERTPLTHDVVRLRFAIETGGPFDFCAGQFAKLEFPFAPGDPRDYSMANAPHEAGLEFHIRLLAGGISAQVRDHLTAGDPVRISGPFGTSYLRDRHRGPIIAIAGSTGLAPIRAIVAAALAARMPGPIHVYIGARAERDVYGEAELRGWAAQHPNLQVQFVLSEPEGTPQRQRRVGLVTDAVRGDFPTLDGWHAYLAGPPAMVDAATEVLVHKGVAPGDLHADAFYGAAGPPERRA